MIIGIGGVSRSGKTSLARRIREILGEEDTALLHQDDYVKNLDDIPRVRGKLDWEHPKSIDVEKYQQAIEKAAKGHEHVIAEGLFAFYWPELSNLYDLKIFIHIPREEFLSRKEDDERWGMEPDWYIEHIWDCYAEYGEIDTKTPGFVFFSGDEKISDEDLREVLS